MLLRNSISNTKKFFQKTIDNFKSFLSKGSSSYQRLPKSAPCRYPFSCGHDANEVDVDSRYNNELDHFYNEFTHQWDSRKRKVKNTTQKKKSVSCQKEDCNHAARVEENISNFDNVQKENNAENREVMKSKVLLNVSPRSMKYSDLCSKSVREKRLCSVAEKLKDFEVMDNENVVNHKRDYQEFLHYYSRLSCPAYLDIVDKFFMEMCTEFFGPETSSKVSYSKPMLQTLKV